ncbi:DUF1573 domain-containing protein [bacterium]|nr:DUF1573 domain-containing protein [bacterium]MCB2201689.1 DUF1573 domain-containing protein [bacterium]
MKKLLVVVSTLLFVVSIRPARAGVEYVDLSYDFGHIALDFTVLANYTVYNTGPETITIDSVRVNCDCSQAFALDSILEPGDTTVIRLSFETTNFFGPNNKQFTVYTSDPKRPTLKFYYLSVVGQWFNGIRPEPHSLFFLPPHKKKEIKVANVKYDEIQLDFAGQIDTVYDVKVTHRKAGKGGSVSAEVIPKPNLRGGTYLGNVRFKVTVPDEDPVYLTIPVKIVRY